MGTYARAHLSASGHILPDPGAADYVAFATRLQMGHRRMAISASPRLARLLGVSIEELFGEPARSSKRGPTPQLQQKIERLSRLPKSQQKMPLQMLDGMLSQAGR